MRTEKFVTDNIILHSTSVLYDAFSTFVCPLQIADVFNDSLNVKNDADFFSSGNP